MLSARRCDMNLHSRGCNSGALRESLVRTPVVATAGPEESPWSALQWLQREAHCRESLVRVPVVATGGPQRVPGPVVATGGQRGVPGLSSPHVLTASEDVETHSYKSSAVNIYTPTTSQIIKIY